MKRIAAPMVGGLVTSAFLTLEIIPVIYTYWRGEQLLWRRLGEAKMSILQWLERCVAVLQVAGMMLVTSLVARLYVAQPGRWLALAPMVVGATMLISLIAYLLFRRRAKLLLTSLISQEGKDVTS